MKTKTLLLLSLLLAGTVDAQAGGAVTARTDAFRLDLRPSPRVVAAGATESLAYSTRWDGGDAAAIALDGEAFGSYAGEGTANWTPTASGLYAFTHSASLGGAAVGETLTASFLVEGADASDLTILATSDLKEGTGIALGGVPAGWTLHYTTDGSVPTAASPEYTGPFTLPQSATVKVVAVSPGGFVSDVAERRFDLAPPLAVTGAQARQRYPWNGLVDVDFTLEGDPLCTYRVALVARDVDGGTNLAVRTVWEDRGSVTNDAVDLRPGVHRLVWNAAADLPEGFAADRVAIGVRADSVQDTALYMVVDLSGGPDAERYPVSYLPDVPEGGWTDEYKTEKLVLRRIEPGTGETCGEPMFAAVFETTQGQFENVTGTNNRVDPDNGSMRPAGESYLQLRGTNRPDEDVTDTSILGLLRKKTHMPGLDVPTTNQWQYACRAGTATDLNSGKNLTATHDICPNADEVGRYYGNSGWRHYNETAGTIPWGTWDGKGSYDRYSEVGAYMSNAWSIYDMHGNAWEWCREKHGDAPIVMGGAFNSPPIGMAVSEVAWYPANDNSKGFRLFLHDAPAVVEAPIVAPAGLTATSNRVSDITLAWEPVSGAYAYQIRRSKTGAFADGTWLNTVTNTTYADWTAESCTNYTYWVRAQFESGRVGQWSEAAQGRRSE